VLPLREHVARMNPVGELLAAEDVALDLDVSGKGALLERMAWMLAQRSSIPSRAVLDSLLAREELGSTALGHGVAIPHARMPQCVSPACVFIRTKFAIPFDALDGKPVAMFLGLIVPKQAAERHLKLLAAAAGMFGDRALREKLRSCSETRVARALIASWPEETTAQQPERPLG
jgi:PTS system nitrogen regulatory IIA component